MTTSKSPRKVLRESHELARRALPAYSHRFSPRKFTQHQLFAILALKEFLRCDYRKIVEVLGDSSDLRREIGLESVPHFTALNKAAGRLLTLDKVQRLLDATVARARKKRSSAGG